MKSKVLYGIGFCLAFLLLTISLTKTVHAKPLLIGPDVSIDTVEVIQTSDPDSGKSPTVDVHISYSWHHFGCFLFSDSECRYSVYISVIGPGSGGGSVSIPNKPDSSFGSGQHTMDIDFDQFEPGEHTITVQIYEGEDLITDDQATIDIPSFGNN